MDLDKHIRALYDEMKALDKTIARLEAQMETKTGQESSRPRRGRKSMSPEERQEVSRRMAAYWAAQRAKKGDGITNGGTPVSG